MGEYRERERPLRLDVSASVSIVALTYFEAAFIGGQPLFCGIRSPECFDCECPDFPAVEIRHTEPGG